MVYFARTHETLSAARDGKLLLLVGCVVLLGCAAVVFSTGPRWAAVLIAAPAVICGGLALADDETLLPQIAALPTFALAVAGAVGVLAKRGPHRGPTYGGSHAPRVGYSRDLSHP